MRADVPRRALPMTPTALTRQVREVVRLAGFPGRLSVAIVDDAAMRVLNRTFHACDEPTDVLAFPLAAPPGTSRGVRGARDAFDAEVVVSVDTARLEASERGVTLASELLLYVVHGVLHLMGEDDHAPAAYRRMHARALAILARLGHVNTIDPAAAKLGPPDRRHRRHSPRGR